MAEPIAAYPMSLSIDYPDRKLNKLTTFFRPFMAIPIIIILGLLIDIGTGYNWGGEDVWSYRYAAAMPNKTLITGRHWPNGSWRFPTMLSFASLVSLPRCA